MPRDSKDLETQEPEEEWDLKKRIAMLKQIEASWSRKEDCEKALDKFAGRPQKVALKPFVNKQTLEYKRREVEKYRLLKLKEDAKK